MRRLDNRPVVTARLAREPATGLAVLAMVVAIMMGGRSAVAQAPGSAQAAPLARYLPQQDLAVYLEFEGLDAHAAAWHKSAAYKLLNDTSLGALLEDIAGQVVEMAQASGPPDKKVPPANYLSLLKHGARNGFAFGVVAKGPQNTQTVVVIRKGNRPEDLKLLESAAASPGQPETKPESFQKSGRTIHPLATDGVWWLEKDDLVLTDKTAVDAVIEVIEGKRKTAVDHPVRTALTRAENGIEPAAYGFVDLAALPPLPPNATTMGLDGLKRIELQWGFQDDALVTLIHAIAPAPRRGVLALFDQPTFDLKSLPPIPAGQSAFGVFSVDLAKTYDQIIDLNKESNPPNAPGIEAAENAFRQQFGLDLRNDLLRHLGPRIAIYSQGAGVPQQANPVATMMLAYTGMTLSIQVKDEAALRKQLEVLIKGINQVLAQGPQAAGGADPPQLRKKEGPHTQYVLEFPPGSVPEGPFAAFSPTIALDKEQLIISGTIGGGREGAGAGPGVARAALVGHRCVRASGGAAPPEHDHAGGRRSSRDHASRDREPARRSSRRSTTQMAATRPGGPGPQFDLKIDPAKLPRAEQLRPLLFPASTALTVDDQGINFLQREPVPSLTSPSTAGSSGRAHAARRLSRRARRPAAPSAPTTSSRSCWRGTIIIPQTTSSPRTSPTRTASRS